LEQAITAVPLSTFPRSRTAKPRGRFTDAEIALIANSPLAEPDLTNRQLSAVAFAVDVPPKAPAATVVNANNVPNRLALPMPCLLVSPTILSGGIRIHTEVLTPSAIKAKSAALLATSLARFQREPLP
jgi:hypothetical protein